METIDIRNKNMSNKINETKLNQSRFKLMVLQLLFKRIHKAPDQRISGSYS